MVGHPKVYSLGIQLLRERFLAAAASLLVSCAGIGIASADEAQGFLFGPSQPDVPYFYFVNEVEFSDVPEGLCFEFGRKYLHIEIQNGTTAYGYPHAPILMQYFASAGSLTIAPDPGCHPDATVAPKDPLDCFVSVAPDSPEVPAFAFFEWLVPVRSVRGGSLNLWQCNAPTEEGFFSGRSAYEFVLDFTENAVLFNVQPNSIGINPFSSMVNLEFDGSPALVGKDIFLKNQFLYSRIFKKFKNPDGVSGKFPSRDDIGPPTSNIAARIESRRIGSERILNDRAFQIQGNYFACQDVTKNLEGQITVLQDSIAHLQKGYSGCKSPDAGRPVSPSTGTGTAVPVLLEPIILAGDMCGFTNKYSHDILVNRNPNADVSVTVRIVGYENFTKLDEKTEVHTLRPGGREDLGCRNPFGDREEKRTIVGWR